MQGKRVPQKRGESPFVRRLLYVALACVILLVLPLYLLREGALLQASLNEPIAQFFLGEQFSIRQAIRELNNEGKEVHMNQILKTHTAGDRCSGATPAFPRGRHTAVTFTMDNTERHAIVYVPYSYPNASATSDASPVALMVLFHGLNDNCQHFLDATGFIPYADRDGFLILSACGSQGYLGTAWNSGTCCGFSGDTPNDIALAQLMAAEVSQSMCVDADRVMAVGFSNGAMLTEVLACEAASTFRAVASIGGVVELRPGNEAGMAKCTAVLQTTGNRTSVLMVHGDADQMVPWGGRSFLGFPPIPSNVAGWVERNVCDPSNSTSTIHTETYVNTIYGDCQAQSVKAKETPRMNHSTHEQRETDEAPFPQTAKSTSSSVVATVDRGTSVIELVKVSNGAHRWPHDNEFSTTDHIIDFGERVFGKFG